MPVTELRGLPAPPPDALLADAAASGFARRAAGLSARETLTPPQVRAFARLIAVAGTLGLAAPGLLAGTALMLAPVIFLAVILFRLALLGVALVPRRRASLPPGLSVLLPTYTVLVALKDEAPCVPQLARMLRGFDYPDHLLDVKLLLETGDTETRDAIEADTWPRRTELLVLPPGDPQTKPRALNYGLSRAAGAYVVVYDAEDRPHPGQLRAAAEAFARSGPQLACLQAPLVGTPASGGWLSRQWALEYAIQFGLILPALARLGLPIALGGTSNHFRRSVLRGVGGWDAWNVTEDADLGLRLARLGWRVGTISSPTLEAPPEKGRVWLAQRSRWLKGFVQTWLVLMRDPAGAFRSLGAGGFASVQLTLGAAILSALVHGPWMLWCLACLASPGLTLGPVGMAGLVLSLVTGALSAALAPGRPLWCKAGDILTLPLYWPLQTLAMVRALWSLVRRPHYWAKTPHPL
ncbi:MAG: glycosyltransferase family 2 protein [Hyphomonas sp.]|uniref:glycosyltransferase family 2 protein n=1 Tax=Hyphomonas sp. TaxID=87 RepID=UPI003529A0B5